MSIQPAHDRDRILRARRDRPAVSHLTFAVPGDPRRTVRVQPPGEAPARDNAYEDVMVVIENARHRVAAPSLDREGFALHRHDTAVRDFHDPDEVRSVYYPEVERFVEAATGARAVLAFDHNTRTEAAAPRNGDRRAVRVAHNDYTERSGPQRVRDLLPPDDAALVGAGRFAIVNLWRPIVGPVEQWPLAVADARSVVPSALIPTDLVYPDRVGEIYEVAHGRGQRWLYFPAMEADEALLLKGYDSRTDGTARFVPHTAFDDPATPPDAAPRQSIEVRTLVYYGPEG